MTASGVAARRFVTSYPARLSQLKLAAGQTEALLEELLGPEGFDIHLIEARAKAPASVAAKVLRKKYGSPSRQMTDLVGARVITFYADEVDPIALLLGSRLKVDVKRSVDKRRSLGLREFGYRSVHLICEAQGGQLTRFPFLMGIRFEVQVRSLLEHSWAETEHEIVYKSGVVFPDEFKRKFSSIAATLEFVDDAYVALRERERQLVAEYQQRYAAGLDDNLRLDAARLVGLMQAIEGDRPGWREGRAPAFSPAKLAARFAYALPQAGILSAANLRGILADSAFKSKVAVFAAESGIDISEVSHIGLLLLAIGFADYETMSGWFPQESLDPRLQTALAS
jgi:ppGpp synthetase/RelA/SpoT-type nucleotidyltranferase